MRVGGVDRVDFYESSQRRSVTYAFSIPVDIGLALGRWHSDVQIRVVLIERLDFGSGRVERERQLERFSRPRFVEVTVRRENLERGFIDCLVCQSTGGQNLVGREQVQHAEVRGRVFSCCTFSEPRIKHKTTRF